MGSLRLIISRIPGNSPLTTCHHLAASKGLTLAGSHHLAASRTLTLAANFLTLKTSIQRKHLAANRVLAGSRRLTINQASVNSAVLRVNRVSLSSNNLLICRPMATRVSLPFPPQPVHQIHNH